MQPAALSKSLRLAVRGNSDTYFDDDDLDGQYKDYMDENVEKQADGKKAVAPDVSNSVSNDSCFSVSNIRAVAPKSPEPDAAAPFKREVV